MNVLTSIARPVQRFTIPEYGAKRWTESHLGPSIKLHCTAVLAREARLGKQLLDYFTRVGDFHGATTQARERGLERNSK